MGENRYQDLIAWQTGNAFKQEVTRIVLSSLRASADLKYRSQVLAAAQSVPVNIAEGFLRKSPGDFRRFLAISLGSLGETESRLHDGIELSYFPRVNAPPHFVWGAAAQWLQWAFARRNSNS